MTDRIARRNEQSRTNSRKAGRTTYLHAVVEFWPACIECGTPIRSRPFEPGRVCRCEGVVWRYSDGWKASRPGATS